MANKIQNFDTGEKDNSNIVHLDLDPKINIENKISINERFPGLEFFKIIPTLIKIRVNL